MKLKFEIEIFVQQWLIGKRHIHSTKCASSYDYIDKCIFSYVQWIVARFFTYFPHECGILQSACNWNASFECSIVSTADGLSLMQPSCTCYAHTKHESKHIRFHVPVFVQCFNFKVKCWSYLTTVCIKTGVTHGSQSMHRSTYDVQTA
jgi:hypothetical protein